MPKVRYLNELAALRNIPDDVRHALEKVAQRYVFRANDYYLDLIDWNDPDDPIRQLIIPRLDELESWGYRDISNEASVTVAHGVQHKYTRSVLLLCNDICGAFCRYCFRKRLFEHENDEAASEVSHGIRYISEHPDVRDVILTGGDPLLLSTARLANILSQVSGIRHVKVIRIGTKMPAFNPWRILDDADFVKLIGKHSSTPGNRICFLVHFDHPRELTAPAIQAVRTLLRAGASVLNQCPLIKGVNDNPDDLAELYEKLCWNGVQPYYLFQGRPTVGNKAYEVPIVKSFQIFDAARSKVSGLARCARYCVCHETGKIEVVGVDEDYIYMRHHQAKDVRNHNPPLQALMPPND